MAEWNVYTKSGNIYPVSGDMLEVSDNEDVTFWVAGESERAVVAWFPIPSIEAITRTGE